MKILNGKMFFVFALIIVLFLSFTALGSEFTPHQKAMSLMSLVSASISSSGFTYNAPINPTREPSPILLSFFDKVEESKNLLRHSDPLIIEKSKTGSVIRKQIALAVLNKDTREISEHRVWVNEADIKNYNKNRVINLVPVAANESFNIVVKWWNSFNSVFEIVGKPNMVIVANKYPLLSTSVPDPKQRSGKAYTDIIYVPYSEALQNPELVQAGKDYIEKQVNAAFSDLQASSVQSRSVPGKLVTDVVSKEFVKNIILVEHVDPIAFAVSDDNGKRLTDRVLTIIGTNQEAAYSYTGSPAGANGIAQFISPTYRTMRLTYPSAKLITDFMLGTATHVNAIKAMALFFEAYKREITDKVTSKEVLAQLGGVSEEMMSAAYNGGPNRVVRSVNTYGPNWLSSQFSASITKVFRPETLGYLNKFQAIRGLHLF